MSLAFHHILKAQNNDFLYYQSYFRIFAFLRFCARPHPNKSLRVKILPPLSPALSPSSSFWFIFIPKPFQTPPPVTPPSIAFLLSMITTPIFPQFRSLGFKTRKVPLS